MRNSQALGLGIARLRDMTFEDGFCSWWRGIDLAEIGDQAWEKL